MPSTIKVRTPPLPFTCNNVNFADRSNRRNVNANCGVVIDVIMGTNQINIIALETCFTLLPSSRTRLLCR